MTPEEIAEREVKGLLDKIFFGNMIFRPLRKKIEWSAKEIIKISKKYVEAKCEEK